MRGPLPSVMLALRRTALAAGLAFAALAPVQAEAPKALKIGQLTDMASALSDATGKGSLIASQLAIDDFGGTVLGRKIELRSADHQLKPSVGASIATEWMDRDGVSAIIGVPASSVALAVQALMKDRPDKLMIVTSSVTSELIGKSCVANSIHWSPDFYALIHPVTRQLTEGAEKNWFLMLYDSAAGPPARAAAMSGISAMGGKIVGEVKVPLNAGDVSSFVLQAQASKAKYIAVGFGGTDLVNVIKTAKQFGLQRTGTKIVAFSVVDTDIAGMGFDLASGMVIIVPSHFAMSDEARNFSTRFAEKAGKLPTWMQYGDYQATLHYLRAVQKAGTDDARAVVAAMKSPELTAKIGENVAIRDDNQLVRPMYLVQIKTKDESKFPGDYYNVLSVIPPEKAYSPLAESACNLVKK